LFIISGYDEMREEFLYKNLYSSNDLAEWGPPFNITTQKIWPKVIWSCRSDFIEGRSAHEKWFWPDIPGIDYNCHNLYISWMIQDFAPLKDQYLNEHYLLNLKNIFLEDIAREENPVIIDSMNKIWHLMRSSKSNF